ncbi:MAG TPA: type II secretion system protein [Candidatus Paceibacterota bacterium]|jgi:prepilin-type N-terminal cleavage/methylation domain-containing protein
MKFASSSVRRGFTLIELLVVIAIIGILSSVVLASLNTARNKGADAAIKSNLANARPEAEIFYDTGSTYTGVCGTAANAIGDNVDAAGLAGGSATGDICNVASDGSAWAAAAPLKVQNQFGTSSAGDYYCVDSKGTAKVIDATLASATACP